MANGWSRNVLAMAIERQAHQRQGKAITVPQLARLGVLHGFHWVTLEVPPLESWERGSRWLTPEYRERIESPEFYKADSGPGHAALPGLQAQRAVAGHC